MVPAQIADHLVAALQKSLNEQGIIPYKVVAEWRFDMDTLTDDFTIIVKIPTEEMGARNE